MSIDRVGIHIGSLYIHFYGILIMVGVLAATFLSAKRAKDINEDPERAWDMVTWLVIAGVIGARLWHVLTPPKSMVEQGITFQYYITHPLEILAVWKGGLGIPGAVGGGLLATYLYVRKYKMNFSKWIDIISPGLALAQAIGRIGNFLNQELYGLPSNLPWAIYIERPYRVAEYMDVSTYHPLFLYEMLWNLMNMTVLILLGKKLAGKLKDGDIFLFYLIIYPLGRFLLEFLRIEYSPVAGINANQALMAILFVFAVTMLIIRHRSDIFTDKNKIPPSKIIDSETVVDETDSSGNQ